ncbi:methylenetetrahydrofolate--tRNA-(uracil(54)-C(5))-methyltransferase (FADH(2)-oxidizing) TrmFO [Caloranaerobacter azorensis]|uniref:Methylenetetrahydrofolate--tRNA-(uracil-5-)-methyltransferase TrmFO n=1 Tax=Caloranaerobacter azorensis TaxID=116090 RepID=A0A6P1YE01_9FIRM|nr:methylenetetrahydrofolate--tRNA-(uracil(54)-C(5))-methyltransferase (FADH(2)-oxidizing) TrmFO [Caloranaerobacter azorensis]QIB26206.1 methylenetetrahydrofolate--tRNA-(uracil(54)-C(5))-methyltransferase (FADH(2)-oxidizing) TrmFO [Caloranaerobacter azorensis]
MQKEVVVIGGGLAGCEASWQLANRGIKVRLFEMRPVKNTEAHHTDKLSELVCSNSLKSDSLENAVGLLKAEMRMLKSLIIEAADNNKVPAGGALAVDREKFSEEITNKIYNHPNIELIREEVTEIPIDSFVIVATGPLTSKNLTDNISKLTKAENLYFYDAAAPIVTYESINMEKAFKGSRYNKGDADYINCPMNEEEYERFYEELIKAEVHPLKNFEKQIVFEACMPIEVMAKRGKETLLYGPLKPIGLENPITKEKYHAVVQLRQDNKEGTLYNIVGFQTNLKWGEQKRVFSLIPALENAEFVRYGVMHRNTYIDSPKVLKPTYQLKEYKNIMFAGQITGVEGYVESAASGLVAGINMSRILLDKEPIIFPLETALGSLSNYISDGSISDFQPMHINFGIMPKLEYKVKNKKERNRLKSERSLKVLQKFIKDNKILVD